MKTPPGFIIGMLIWIIVVVPLEVIFFIPRKLINPNSESLTDRWIDFINF